jgi:hypothetical protein
VSYQRQQTRDKDPMNNDSEPLDADELMNFAERIEQLPPADALWAECLFQECLRARTHEAELLCGLTSEDGVSGRELEMQLAQVALDTTEWLNTLWNVGYMGAGCFPAQPRSAFPQIGMEDILKSALFARIREGKRPLPFPPPTRQGLPWHDLLEGQRDSHPVAAEILRDDCGRAIGANIEACPDWRLIEECDAGSEYIVQHLGKGPLFRLRLEPSAATLRREAPRWQRRIRLQERGGFSTYSLEWPQENGQAHDIALRATTWERAESEAAHWIAREHPEMYGQVSFERVE